MFLLYSCKTEAEMQFDDITQRFSPIKFADQLIPRTLTSPDGNIYTDNNSKISPSRLKLLKSWIGKALKQDKRPSNSNSIKKYLNYYLLFMSIRIKEVFKSIHKVFNHYPDRFIETTDLLLQRCRIKESILKKEDFDTYFPYVLEKTAM